MINADLVEALEAYNSSFVVVKCSDEQKSAVKQMIKDLFFEKWCTTFQNVVEDIDVPYEEDDDYYPQDAESSYPLEEIFDIDEGLLLYLSPLVIYYCYGEFCYVSDPCDWLGDSLQLLKEKLPDIDYVGFVAFPWSDRRCGDVEVYSLGSVKGHEEILKKYIGQIINFAVDNKRLFGTEDVETEPWRFLDEVKDAYQTNREYETNNNEILLRDIENLKPYLNKTVYEKLMSVCK